MDTTCLLQKEKAIEENSRKIAAAGIRYPVLFTLSYVLYAVSFLLPTYKGESMSFCCGGSTTYFGFQCALFVFAFIFTENALAFIALSLPNITMITLLFIQKRIRQVFILFILIFNACSCSYWWVTAIKNGDLGNLLPGYWLWFASIMGSNVILLLNKRKTALLNSPLKT